MLNRVVLRVGAVAAMLGAVIAIVFNILHPRPEELTGEATVQAAVEESIWAFDHYMLAWSVGLLFIALVVIGRSFASEPAASWGRVAAYSAIGSSAIALATIALDGFAVPTAAEVAGTETAVAVAYVSEGVFLAMVGSFFGVTPILFGVAVLGGNEYGDWLGWPPILAGILGLVTGSMVFFDGISTLAVVLFTVGSILFTAWIGVMGLMLWRKVSGMPTSA